MTDWPGTAGDGVNVMSSSAKARSSLGHASRGKVRSSESAPSEGTSSAFRSDKGIVGLRYLKELKTLHLRDTQCTKKQADILMKANSDLKVVDYDELR